MNARDMLDPKAREMLDEMEAADRPDSNELPVDEARANLEDTYASLGPGPEVGEVRDLELPGPAGTLQARLLRGVGAEHGCPLIIWFHGGGHTIGSIETSDAICRGLANAASAAVLTVAYRLAPEDPFPAAYDDAVAAVNWAGANAGELGCDIRRLVMGGDSAGGNLTAAICATDATEFPLAGQLMVYPVVSFARQAKLFDKRFDGFFLSYAEIEHFGNQYVPEGADLTDPRLSPLEAPSLAHVPPAIVVGAECDPIGPQGQAFHERLLAEGVGSERLIYPGMIHGFFGMTSLFEQAETAFTDVADRLNALTAEVVG